MIENRGKVVTAVLWLGLVVGSRAAWAKEPRYHEGLFLRLATGPAFMRESWRPEGGGERATYTGWGPALEVAVGKSVARGLVVAGAAQLAGIINRTETFRGSSYDLASTIHFVDTVGALVDYYPDPRKGFHLGGALGLVAVSELDTHFGNLQTDWGGSASLHVGKETFISDRWSAGVMARVTFYWYGTGDPAPGASSKGFSPTLLLAFTFN